MTRKIAFSERWSWFKFNNLGLAHGTNLQFCTSVAKGLKLKVRKCYDSIPTFVEVTREKLQEPPSLPPILNRVKGEEIVDQYYVAGYWIDFYFAAYNLAIKCDKFGHNHRDIGYDVKKQKDIENKLALESLIKLIKSHNVKCERVIIE